jgi:signal transduction histidine kinase
MDAAAQVAPAALASAEGAPATKDGAPPRPPINLAGLAHEQLRASEARFRLLVEAVKDYAIFMLDPSGRVVTWNAGAARIKGYDAREIIGHHFSEFYPTEDVRAGKCERELEGAARDGRFETRAGASARTAHDSGPTSSSPRCAPRAASWSDSPRSRAILTERRRLELEQLRLGKAEEAIRLRDEFLSLAAHELKTPLTVLQMQLDTLSDRMDQSGSGSRQAAARRAEQRAAREPGGIAARRLAHRDRPLRADSGGDRHRRLRQPPRRWAATPRASARTATSSSMRTGRSSARGTGFVSSRR